jgi:2-succinyl-6-hydroxy-2,4-cyclohexadiene-1-carboxylate synthase
VITGDELTLVGYSLGGRLLLHWPKDQWWRIHKVILLSVHTGLAISAEKNERCANDQKWAKQFLDEEWNKVLQDWNQQVVFNKDLVRPPREETDFERAILAAALNNWSLGTQEDLKGAWIDAPFKVAYITGEHDLKFSAHAKFLKQNGNSWFFQSIPGAGHSLHLSHAQDVIDVMSAF